MVHCLLLLPLSKEQKEEIKGPGQQSSRDNLHKKGRNKEDEKKGKENQTHAIISHLRHYCRATTTTKLKCRDLLAGLSFARSTAHANQPSYLTGHTIGHHKD
jgi:hypothetical protein